MHQTRITDFMREKDLVSDRESDQKTTQEIDRMGIGTYSKIGVVNATKRKRSK